MGKICNMCKLELNINEYYKRTRATDGHQSICKECTRINKCKYNKTEGGKNAWNKYQNNRYYLKKNNIVKEKKEVLTDEEYKENKQIINKKYYLKNRIDILTQKQDLLIVSCLESCEALEKINISLEKMHVKLNDLIELNLY